MLGYKTKLLLHFIELYFVVGAEGVPAGFIFLGIRNETAGSIYDLHTPQFQVDENQMPTGAALLANMAFDFLSQAEQLGLDVGGSLPHSEL